MTDNRISQHARQSVFKSAEAAICWLAEGQENGISIYFEYPLDTAKTTWATTTNPWKAFRFQSQRDALDFIQATHEFSNFQAVQHSFEVKKI